MVWSLSYRPKPDSYPNSEVLEGNIGELELVDLTSDGGAGLAMSRSFSGRRVKPDSVPKVIGWLSSRRLLDFETTQCKTVGDRFRALIEQIEPGVHQFEPVKFVSRDGALLAERWFWQICNRIDSVHRGRSNLRLTGVSWKPPHSEAPLRVFNLVAIGDAEFWHDKYTSGSTFLSDEAKARIEAAGMTGVYFNHYDQA